MMETVEPAVRGAATMSKFSAADRSRIRAEGREHLAWRPPPRDTARTRVVYKTSEPRTPTDDAPDVPAAAPQDWATWWTMLDARVEAMIEARVGALSEAVGQVIGERCDELEHRLNVVRDESKIERGLHTLRQRVESAIERQPDFERELRSLREQLATAQHELENAKKTLSRQRGLTSTLDYRVSEIDREQTLAKAKASISRTTTVTVDVDQIGASTRAAIMEALPRDDGGTIWVWDMTPRPVH
jgi:hypothetical protein